MLNAEPHFPIPFCLPLCLEAPDLAGALAADDPHIGPEGYPALLRRPAVPAVQQAILRVVSRLPPCGALPGQRINDSVHHRLPPMSP